MCRRRTWTRATRGSLRTRGCRKRRPGRSSTGFFPPCHGGPAAGPTCAPAQPHRDFTRGYAAGSSRSARPSRRRKPIHLPHFRLFLSRPERAAASAPSPRSACRPRRPSDGRPDRGCAWDHPSSPWAWRRRRACLSPYERPAAGLLPSAARQASRRTMGGASGGGFPGVGRCCCPPCWWQELPRRSARATSASGRFRDSRTEDMRPPMRGGGRGGGRGGAFSHGLSSRQPPRLC